MIFTIISTITFTILAYYILLTVWCLILMISAFPQVLKKFNQENYGNANERINENCFVPITVITPFYNEEKEILNLIYSVQNSDYKNIKHILVNDGSTNDGIELLKKELQLYEVPVAIKQTIKTEKILRCYKSKRFENITLIDKAHSPYNCGADSINAGINACNTPILATIDADTVIEPEALTRLLFTMLATPHCVLVSGSVYVINDNIVEDGKMRTTQFPRHFIGGMQAVEYLRAFLYGRAGLNRLGGALCYSGTFSLFETAMLREIHGFDRTCFSYDAEITTKIHHYMRKNKYPYTVSHSPNSFCWTDTPNTLKSYWKQRSAWQRGMLRQTSEYINMFFNPRFGIVGLITFPSYVLFEVFSPVVEFISFILFPISLFLGVFDFEIFLWFFLFAWGFVGLTSVAMLFLNQISFNKYNKRGDAFRILFLITIEMFGFRQLRALCCTVGTFKYVVNRLKGKPL